MYPSYVVIKYRDSAKVLKDIAGLQEDRKQALATRRAVGGTGTASECIEIERTISKLIDEVMDNAPKTSDIIPAAAEPLRVDSRNYRSRERDGQWSSEHGLVIEFSPGGNDRRYHNEGSG